VGVAIIWAGMEKIVDSAKNSWYQGGYRANIVTYTISKLFREARALGKEIDLEAIWNRQEVPSGLAFYLEDLAQLIQSVILSPPSGVKNVGEWCKKELCWKHVSALTVPLADSIEKFTISKDEFKAHEQDEKKIGLVDDGISLQSKILELTNSGYWKALYYWQNFLDHFSPIDKALVLKASTLQGFMKISLEKDWKKLLEIKSYAEGEGFRAVK
jgi:hypothetical protein